jgi:hypothetical protein
MAEIAQFSNRVVACDTCANTPLMIKKLTIPVYDEYSKAIENQSALAKTSI